MFFVRILRYVLGYVKFMAQGAFIERFLNLAAREHIPMWQGSKRNNIYTAFITARNYRRLRPLAKKTGTRIRVQEKIGLPFYKKRVKRRRGLIVGFGIFFAFLFIMGQFIWRIEVNGNADVSENEILRALEYMGIKSGTWRKGIDVRKSEREALLLIDGLSWLALNIDGSTVHVEVKESVDPPEIIDPNDPCNVVAAESGLIKRMHVYDGQPIVMEGDAVEKGDILVSGITQDGRGQNLFRHARADIIALAQKQLTVEMPFEQTIFEETGEVLVKRYFSISKLALPLFLPKEMPEHYRVEREKAPVTLFSLTLPFSVLNDKYIAMEEKPITYTEDEAKKMALLELLEMEKKLGSEGEIIEKEILGKATDESFIIKGEYTCILDIAKPQKIVISE